MPYQPGDTVRLSTVFQVGGVATDPSTVTLVVRAPNGTETTYDYALAEITKDSTGNYHKDVVASSTGVYAWKWTGTGPASGIDEGTFSVERSLLSEGLLCSVEDVKSSLELTTSDYDDLIANLVTAASFAIPQRYQREFAPVSGGTRTFSVCSRLIDLAPYDLRSGTLTLHPEETATVLVENSDYVLLPQGGARVGGTYQRLRLSSRLVLNSNLYREFGEARLQIAGNWGPATIDPAVTRAAVLTVSSWLDRAVAAYAVNPLADDGREIRPDRFVNYAIPQAAHSILMPWSRLGTP